MTRVGLRENTRVVDVSGRRGTVLTLTETKIMCTALEKVSSLVCRTVVKEPCE